MLSLTTTLTNAQAAAVRADLLMARDLRAAEMANDQPEPLAESSTDAYMALTAILDALEVHVGKVTEAERRERSARMRAFQRRRARGEGERAPAKGGTP